MHLNPSMLNEFKPLVAAAPSLRSINLGCGSFLTVDTIDNLADKLGAVDEHIFPALLKLEQLEVLSVSHNEYVDNSFIIGCSMSEDEGVCLCKLNEIDR